MPQPSAFLACVMCCLLVLALGACGGAAARAGEEVPGRYHDGRRWVPVAPALDRLHVTRAGAGGAPVTEVYLLRTPVASAAELENVARQMLAAQPDIRDLTAYLRLLESPAVQPVRLTRRFVLRVAPGQDPAVIAAGVDALVDSRDAQDPLLTICAPRSRALFAALVAADALQGAPGVVGATPLLEHARVPRRSDPPAR